MKYKLLIDYLKQYANISKNEELLIRERFFCRNAKKKEILIHKNTTCDKLFFVNKGILRAYSIDSEGLEFTRRIVWEKGFLTNMNSFIKNGRENNEALECIENAEILEITKKDFEYILSTSETLTKIYHIVLEKYVANNIDRQHNIVLSNPTEKLIYFHKTYPKIRNRLNDKILSSFLSISRMTLIRAKRNVLKK